MVPNKVPADVPVAGLPNRVPAELPAVLLVAVAPKPVFDAPPNSVPAAE